MVIEGTLSSGTRIHEGKLGQDLGISRTPLREALKYLASVEMQRYALRDRLSYFKLNQSIHSTILKISGNEPARRYPGRSAGATAAYSLYR
jgi:DNA-binding GntR family transcriptional regulator